jgi:magnesium-transporting ATPase (P-type)
MNELLSKLSSYNLFNHLLPGIIFAVLAGEIIHYPIVQRDILTKAFLYYFLGLVVSRFGSLVIEPLLKRLSFVRFGDYKDFIAASKKDAQLEVLSEANNTYRTLSSLFSLLLMLKVYVKIEGRFPFLREWDATILAVLLLVMFLFSYRKQTSYITKRIKANG